MFLRNGGRLYLDVGAHPEYATPECRTPRELLVAERAGDEIVARLAARASELSAEAGQPVPFRLFKNNVDSFGNSYGCHENYLVSRDLDLDVAAELLATFLVTRQVLCGTGRLHRGEFTISQRADHLHDQLSALTTTGASVGEHQGRAARRRERFRRLHVLAGDSNLLEASAWLKVGTLAAVLELLDPPDGPDPRLASLRLADPGAALQLVARDPGVRLELADGRRPDRDRAAAGPPGAGRRPRRARRWSRCGRGCWTRWPTACPSGSRPRWSGSPSAGCWTATSAGTGWPTTIPGSPSSTWRSTSWVDCSACWRRGGLSPGSPTRPRSRRRSAGRRAVRGRRHRSAFLAAAAVNGRDYTVDWQTCTVHDLAGPDGGPVDRSVVLGDPLATVSEELDELIAAMAAQPRVRATGGFRPPPVGRGAQ